MKKTNKVDEQARVQDVKIAELLTSVTGSTVSVLAFIISIDPIAWAIPF